MKREIARMFMRLLEVPVPATEEQLRNTLPLALRRRSPMRNSKVPHKVWRKALAYYLECRLLASKGSTAALKEYCHQYVCDTIGVTHGTMAKFKKVFGTMSDGQVRTLAFACHRAVSRTRGVTPNG